MTIDTTGGCFESRIWITPVGYLFKHMSLLALQLVLLLHICSCSLAQLLTLLAH